MEQDQINSAILSEQQMIEQNQFCRSQKYNQCMNAYLCHLKQQIQQFEETEQANDKRNLQISDAFKNTYQRITTSSQLTLRKLKQTVYHKKEFWNDLIKNNSHLKDLALKKQLYQHKRDAEDRYQQAIANQNTKMIPYEILLGKLDKKQNLKEWQINNKMFEDKVYQGTNTMHQWKTIIQANRPISDTMQNIPQFVKDHMYSNSLSKLSQKKVWQGTSQYNNNFLKNFQRVQKH